MWRLAIFAVLLVLAGCQQDEPAPDTGLAGYDPDNLQIQRDACIKRGGRFGKGGLSGSFVCYENTRDANQRCAKDSDCEGFCLARSRSCAPVKPFFGCNDVLTNSGALTTVCIE